MLVEAPFTPGGAIVVTGATGLVGQALARSLQQSTPSPLILPVRKSVPAESLLRNIPGSGAVTVIPVTAEDDPRLVAQRLQELQATTIVHAAGCCHFTDEVALQQGNQELTAFWLEVGRLLDVDRFVYISTAFSCGAISGDIPEALHWEDPSEELTPYLRSKRQTEHLVAESGLPTLMVRPGIVVGDSRTGEYRGKTYGLYQLWAASHRWLLPEDFPQAAEILSHSRALPLIHVDMLQEIFLAALRWVPPGSILHAVSTSTELSGMLDLVELWMRSEIALPLPARASSSSRSRMKMWTSHSRINLDISRRHWPFRQEWLQALAPHLSATPSITKDSLFACQEWFRAHVLASEMD